MEPKPTGNDAAPQRKLRFAPKLKAAKKPKPTTVVKTEVKIDEDNDSKAQDLLRQFNEGFTKGKAKIERKVAPTQIAFGYGGAATSSKPVSSRRVLNDAHQHPGFSGLEKEYKEPWDYYTYYPVTLPLRKPYSGNPELLDEEEFAGGSENVTYNENLINTPSELSLAEESSEPQLLCLQIPSTLPMMKSSGGGNELGNLNELPEGYMGKLVVYRSGAMKMKLGDTLFDVSSGSQGIFAQNIVAVSAAEKQYCSMGELNKVAVVTPAVESILESLIVS